MILTLAALAAPLAAPAPQGNVIETVTLDDAFVGTGVNVGLSNLIDESHGIPVRVSAQLVATIEISGSYTNNQSFAENPFFWIVQNIYPNSGDCTPYRGIFQQYAYGTLAPGQTLDLARTETVDVSFDQAAPFSPFCFQDWNWTDLLVEPDITIPSTLHTSSPLFTGSYSIRLTGEVQFEYEPVDLGTTSVCPGTQPGGAPLTVAGSPRAPWFFQANAPAAAPSIVVVSTTASSIVPLNGLCIAEGGGRVARLTDPADLSMNPIQGSLPAVLSGTTIFFQSWMAGTNGGPPTTGECVSVMLP